MALEYRCCGGRSSSTSPSSWCWCYLRGSCMGSPSASCP
ncbi:hypothetical protein CFC21_073226, partial [Triticum aestivum]